MDVKTIPIFFAFDNNYVEPAAVAFYSLLDHAKNNIFYEMYVLHSNITEEKQNLLTSIVNKHSNGKLTFINTNNFGDEIFKNGNFSHGHSNSVFTSDTLVRCFASRFLPNIDKIIYSDVDIVVVDDISPLYDIDITNNYVAGVKDPFSKFSPDALPHLTDEKYKEITKNYIGAGIWVMNLKKIREDNLEETMLDIATDQSIEKHWPDQDVMNIACNGKVGFIPLNYISYPYLIDFLENPEFTSDYTREELYDSIINPKIIHFAANKPWNSNPKYSNLWWTYFNYLKLEKTKIFIKKADSKDSKIKKYKKRYNILLITCILLLLLNITLLAIGL